VVDTPLAESGIVGTAIGLALRGYRPVCEIQFDGFVFPAFDQIVSQLAKMRMRSQGRAAVPVTIRIPFGGGIGAVEHHSESPEALFAHTAGLRVVACSGPADAYTLIQQAENHVLIPLIMKEGIDIPPVLTILVQASFAIVLGFLGLLVAVPLLGALMVPIKMLYVEDVVGDEVTVPGESAA